MDSVKIYSIYKLICSETNRFYIGSTMSSLHDRLIRHSNLKYNGSTSKCLINPTIELIETIETDNHDIVYDREKEMIKICMLINKDLIVNKNIPNRKPEEYYNDMKKSILEYKKEFYKVNKDKIKLQRLLYYYRNHDINKIKNKKIKEILLNKKKPNRNEYLKDKLVCSNCNSIVSRRHMARHRKTNKHLFHSTLNSSSSSSSVF